MKRIRYCTFHVDGQFFGLEVRRVREVLQKQPITPLPLTPRVVRGLINLRGQIVTAIDLRRCLGLGDRGPAGEEINVVVRDGEESWSLLADATGEVLEVASQTMQKPPATLTGPGRELIQGVYALPGRLLLALDLERILKTARA